ncbi:aminotransferase class V-fold PLP-dependent enzyme [Acidaminobacterium chupaoyuni]
MIYLDNAATTLFKPSAVKNAVIAAMDSCGNPGRSGHKPAMKAAAVVYACRETIAEFFGIAEPERVVFTQNATHALNLAIKSQLKEGDHVVISGYEHNSVVRPLEGLAEKGINYTAAYSALFDQNEMFEKLAAAITESTSCMVVNHVSNVFGSIAPLKKIDELCAEKGLALILDLSQSAGVIPIDLSEFQSVTYACMPGHKSLYGPQGTGILICCGEGPYRSLMEGGTGSNSLERRQPEFLPDVFESGTMNVAGIAGLNEGVRFLKKRTVETVGRWEAHLVSEFTEKLRDLEGLVCYAPPVPESGVVSLKFNKIPSERAAELLAEMGVCVRAGLHCAPLAHHSAGTLPDGTVRFSFCAFNTDLEVQRAAQCVKKLLTQG